MRESRIIGNNINLIMKRKGFTRNQLAEKLGILEEDILRIMSGRLLLTGNEIKKVADILEVKPQELVEEKNNEEYKELIHCMGRFDRIENVDVILDYIDTYITLAEDCIN